MNIINKGFGPFASPLRDYRAMLAGPEFGSATRQDFDALLSDLERAACRAPYAPSVHLALSSAVCFALTHHAYPLAASLVKDRRPDALILELPSDWEARDADFARLFDGLPVSSLTLGACDSRDRDAAFGGELPADLTHLACRMIEAKTTHEVSILNALPQATQDQFCSALESGEITAFHLLPHFSTEAQLADHGRGALAVLTALGNCPGLRTLSVNFTALGPELSCRVLGKGALTSLTVDMDHFGPLQALDDEEVAGMFSGLQDCGKLQSLTIRHSAITPAALNAHVLARLAGNQFIKELAIRSDLPLHGGGRHFDALATTFELLNTCVGLQTFRLECPIAASPARVACKQVYVAGKDRDYARASVRLSRALRVSPLRRLFINGLVLHGATALGLAHGIGGNASLEEVDLSGCTFLLNHAPQFILRLMANQSICLMAMPGPQTMIFLAESDGIVCNLVQRNESWEVDAAATGAKADFDAFEGGGAAYAQNFSYLACVKVAHRNAQLRKRAW